MTEMAKRQEILDAIMEYDENIIGWIGWGVVEEMSNSELRLLVNTQLIIIEGEIEDIPIVEYIISEDFSVRQLKVINKYIVKIPKEYLDKFCVPETTASKMDYLCETFLQCRKIMFKTGDKVAECVKVYFMRKNPYDIDYNKLRKIYKHAVKNMFYAIAEVESFNNKFKDDVNLETADNLLMDINYTFKELDEIFNSSKLIKREKKLTKLFKNR